MANSLSFTLHWVIWLRLIAHSTIFRCVFFCRHFSFFSWLPSSCHIVSNRRSPKRKENEKMEENTCLSFVFMFRVFFFSSSSFSFFFCSEYKQRFFFFIFSLCFSGKRSTVPECASAHSFHLVSFYNLCAVNDAMLMHKVRKKLGTKEKENARKIEEKINRFLLFLVRFLLCTFIVQFILLRFFFCEVPLSPFVSFHFEG